MGVYRRAIDRFLRTRIGGWTALHVMNGKLSTAVGTDFHENGVLLRRTGAKSGKPRDIPLLATPFDDGWVLIASATGVEKNPAWFHNLKAHARCSLVVPGRGEVACLAREAQGAERERAWQAADDQYFGYTVYQGRTDRRIPVMIVAPER